MYSTDEMSELEYLQGLCDRLRERLGIESNAEILETVIHLQDEVQELSESSRCRYDP